MTKKKIRLPKLKLNSYESEFDKSGFVDGVTVKEVTEDVKDGGVFLY